MGKIRTVYRSLSEPVKASFWFTICNIVQKGIALLFTPAFTRIMTTEQYGQYSVYQSWYAIVSIFATLNLYMGVYNNGMVKWPEERKRFTSAMQGLSTTLTLCLFMIYLIAIPFWNQVLGMSIVFMLAMFAELLFVPAYNFWSAGKRFDYKYVSVIAATLIIAVFSPVIALLAVLSAEYKAEAMVLSFVLVQICVGIVLYLYNMSKGKVFYHKGYWKFALAFNCPLVPHYLSQTILGQADRIMIADMVGKKEAAIYSVAFTISMMFSVVTSAVNNTFIPYTYKTMRDQQYHALKKNSKSLVLAVNVFCVIAMLFGSEIIRLFAAPEYYDARWVVPPVAEALLFMFICPLFCNIEFYYEKTKFIMLASGIAACTNICLNYIGIQVFGYIAAAYATLICYIVLSIAHYFAYKAMCKEEGVKSSDLYDIPFLLKVSVSSLLTMVVITMIYDYMLVRYLLILVIVTGIFLKRKEIVKAIMEIRKE